jgi:hydrogenase maturation protease
MSLMSLATPAGRPPLLVMALGNPSRGDDAFGALMAERLLAWLRHQPPERAAQVELICELQLHAEHVFDLQGRERVLFIDARVAPASGDPQSDGTPTVHRGPLAAVNPQTTWDSHRCPPATLLGLHRQLLGVDAPPAEVLSARTRHFELGAPPSNGLTACLDEAWVSLQAWLDLSFDPPAG